MTAEGARGCAWRAAGRRCRGCRHADVSRHRTQPYRTVPYHTVSYLTAGTYGKEYLTLSLSKKARGKESRCGKPAKMWKTLWKTCFKALRPLREGAGAAGSLMGTFRRAWSGGGAAVDRSGARGRGCGGADAGSGGGRARRSMGQCRQGGVRVRQGLLVGPSLERAFGRCGCGGRFCWRVVAAVRCGTRVQRGARWLDFLPREKMLDKLCKSILNWKQGITQAAAGDGLRHRPHRRSCSVYPTSTSSVAATSVMCCASDARLTRAALRKTETKNSAQHRFDAGRSFVTAAAPARLPFRWLSGCLSAGYPARLPFRWLSCAAAFPQPFLCACGHRAAFLTRPSRSCPRATPRTGCAYGRSGGRTPSSPATTAGRTR